MFFAAYAVLNRVLSHLAGVAVQFSYQFLGTLFGNADLGALWENRLVARPSTSTRPQT